ncbi:hypothetical protein BM1_08744 [Bipolaris maydis]|nr:hypothetical protein BM1_08744 [Bipolaris maydis]
MDKKTNKTDAEIDKVMASERGAWLLMYSSVVLRQMQAKTPPHAASRDVAGLLLSASYDVVLVPG